MAAFCSISAGCSGCDSVSSMAAWSPIGCLFLFALATWSHYPFFYILVNKRSHLQFWKWQALHLQVSWVSLLWSYELLPIVLLGVSIGHNHLSVFGPGVYKWLIKVFGFSGLNMVDAWCNLNTVRHFLYNLLLRWPFDWVCVRKSSFVSYMCICVSGGIDYLIFQITPKMTSILIFLSYIIKIGFLLI